MGIVLSVSHAADNPNQVAYDLANEHGCKVAVLTVMPRDWATLMPEATVHELLVPIDVEPNLPERTNAFLRTIPNKLKELGLGKDDIFLVDVFSMLISPMLGETVSQREWNTLTTRLSLFLGTLAQSAPCNVIVSEVLVEDDSKTDFALRAAVNPALWTALLRYSDKIYYSYPVMDANDELQIRLEDERRYAARFLRRD